MSVRKASENLYPLFLKGLWRENDKCEKRIKCVRNTRKQKNEDYTLPLMLTKIINK
jgi:hypothetical protein